MPPQPIEVLDTVLGASYRAIEAALDALDGETLDLSPYEFTVAKAADALIVGMSKGERKEGEPFALGATMPLEDGFEAARELDQASLQALATRREQVETVDSLHGEYLPAIRSALPAFDDCELDLVHYRIKVVRDGDVLVVIFVDKDLRPGTRGGGRKRAGMEVMLNPENLQVLRSNLIR